MKEERRVTISYLLGAGASFQALPVVNEFPQELQLFKDYILQYNSFKAVNKYTNLMNHLSNFQRVIDDSKLHYSIDTLAKKYWLKQNKDLKLDFNEEYNWYQLIKNIISCYFIWKRITKLDDEILHLIKKDSRLNQLLKVDPRYDAFLAALLNDNLKLPENIYIVSWNYDLQIEQSFNFYYDEFDVKKVGNILGIDYYQNNSSGSIIKLNGSSLIKLKENILLKNIYDDEFHSFIIDAIKNDYNNEIFSSVRFAWEKSEHSELNRKKAQNFFTESNIIVVIGYSFPIFNREIDIEIFSGFVKKKGVKKIYIQASEEDAPRIKSQLESISSGLSEIAEIISNKDQFFLPNEFFNNIDPNIEIFIA